MQKKIFGEYDLRGVYPDTLNEKMAYSIGKAFVKVMKASKVVVGNDIRLSGPSLKEALMKGLTEAGCDVVDIGQCGTEMIYFATFHMETDGGIMVTASHNPKAYNGMKFVGKGAAPISRQGGLNEIEQLMLSEEPVAIAAKPGKIVSYNIMEEYIQHLLSYVDTSVLKPMKLVCNAGNGAAGPVLDKLSQLLPFEIVKINNQPDGNFPNGVPNPLLPENRAATSEAVIRENADLGIAWDGDFDRCFFFDEKGNFIEGYYVVGFLAEAFLAKNKGEKIVHDPRVYWNTVDIVNANGGIPVMSKSGHAIIKAVMRQEDAIYGGEMSAHHYFRDFAYCDSGMIPWLLVTELLSRRKQKMSELLQERIDMYPCSGEINSQVMDAEKVLNKIEKLYGDEGKIEKIDGLGITYKDWRMNLRRSNTEPYIRLNVESRGNKSLLKDKTQEILSIIKECK